MTSQPGKQTISIYILPNISTSKGNQTIKFCQLIECYIRNIFLKKHTQNVVCGRETIPRPFLKNQQ